MSDWIVSWQGGSQRCSSEGEAERIERVLVREFGMVVNRRPVLAPVEQFRQAVRVPDDEALVRQVKEQQAALSDPAAELRGEAA